VEVVVRVVIAVRLQANHQVVVLLLNLLSLFN
jgi:hypothetical protein